MSIINNMPNPKSGMTIDGIIEDYYVYAGKNISAGDFVEFVNGVAGSVDYGTSLDTKISTLVDDDGVSAVELSNGNVFVVYPNSDGYLCGIVLTINGATINVGVETQLSTDTKSGYGASPLLLENGEVFVAHSYGSNYYLYGMIVSIQGTAIAVKVDSEIHVSTYGGRSTSPILLENGNIFIAYSYLTSYNLRACIVSINGTTITRGHTLILDDNDQAGEDISTIVLENNKIFIVNSRSNRLYGMICVVDGITINNETNTSISSSVYSGTHLSAVKLSNNNIFIAHSKSDSYHLYGIACSITDTTITTGIDTALSLDRAGARISAVLLKNGKVFVAHSLMFGSAAGGDLYGLIVSVNNTTVTAGTDTGLCTTEELDATAIKALTLSNEGVFLAHTYTSDSYVYGQIWGVDETNNIPTNKVILTTYETQVQKTTTSKFDGVAKTAGTGGTSTAHRDKISIYTK